MLLALTGFVMIGLLMYFLLKGKAIPVTLFVVLPIIGALINGFGIADITDYIKSGVSTTWGMAALFVFVITYFGIMTDVGMFDKLVKKLIKIANGRVLGILLVVVLVSILGHLDGNSPTTYLIVIPAMAPLCKKLNIRISTIMMVCTATITVMNLVPWGGVLNRQSITLAMDGMGVAFAPDSYYRFLLQGRHDRPKCYSVGKIPLRTTTIAAHEPRKYLPQYARDYIRILQEYTNQYTKYEYS